MKKELYFKSVVYDNNTVPAGQIEAGTSYQFFVDTDYSDKDRVTAPREQELVEMLFQQQLTRNLILTELGCPTNARCKCEVKEPILDNTNQKPGDIDFLIWQEQKPHQSIASECKRVKVTPQNLEKNEANRIRSIGAGVQQANCMRELGFYQTYLTILIAVDGSQRNENNFISRGPTPTIVKKVYEFPWRDRLHKDVGVVFIEINQPIGKSIDKAGVVGICVDKKATPLEQPTDLTNRINELTKLTFNTT